MQSLVRVYIEDATDPKSPARVDLAVTRKELENENLDAPGFAETVWQTCERQGAYDDSDPRGRPMVVYYRGWIDGQMG